MRNCGEYILREDKTEEDLTYMTGPAPDELTGSTVYKAFMDEKKLWHKEDGRLYSHNIISFHENEEITPQEALQFGIDFAYKWFPEHQTVVAVHTDKNHVHIHLMTNTVSFVDGHKLHTTKHDLARMKELTNQMCVDRGLSIARKGHHFNGEKIEQGEVISWSKDKYNLMRDMTKKSYVADCAIAVMKTLEAGCCSRDDFIGAMQSQGWQTNWSDTRKNITFENENGEKVRDSNIAKTFNMDIGKGALIDEFERQNRIRQERELREQSEEYERQLREQQELSEQSEYSTDEPEYDYDLEEYYRELTEEIYGRIDSEGTGEGRARTQGNTGAEREDTDAFIRNLDIKERASEEKRKNSEIRREVSEGQRAYREAEQRRLDFEREREATERNRRYQSSLSDSYLGH